MVSVDVIRMQISQFLLTKVLVRFVFISKTEKIREIKACAIEAFFGADGNLIVRAVVQKKKRKRVSSATQKILIQERKKCSNKRRDETRV